MSILNSNNFLYKTVDGVKQFFSPLVNASTVVLEDGSRLEKDGKIYADEAANAINAENAVNLGGKDAYEYLQKSDAFRMELLWENAGGTISNGATLTLAGNVTDYDYLAFVEGSAWKGDHLVFIPIDVGNTFDLDGVFWINETTLQIGFVSGTMNDTSIYYKGKWAFNITTSPNVNGFGDGSDMNIKKIYGVKGAIK